jgi:hypothetical protein
MKKCIFSAIALIVVAINIYAHPDSIPVITRIMKSPIDSFGYSRDMLAGPENSCYVSGFYNLNGKSFVARLNANGEVMWRKDISNNSSGFDDETVCLALTPDSGIIFLRNPDIPSDSMLFSFVDRSGVETRIAKTEVRDVSAIVPVSGGGWFIAYGNSVEKLNATGERVWQRKFSSPAYALAPRIYGICNGEENSVLVTGELKPSQGWGYLWYGRVDANGNTVWQKNIMADSVWHSNDLDNQARGLSIQVLPDRTFIVYCVKRSGYGSWVLKVDAAGDTMGSKPGKQRGIYFSKMELFHEGKTLVTSGDNGSIFCIDTAGTTLWEKTTHFGTTPYTTGVVKTNNGYITFGADRLEKSSYDTIALRMVEFKAPPRLTEFTFFPSATISGFWTCRIIFQNPQAFKSAKYDPDFNLATEPALCSNIYLDKMICWVVFDSMKHTLIRWNSDTSGLLIEIDSAGMDSIIRNQPCQAIYCNRASGYCDTVPINGLLPAVAKTGTGHPVNAPDISMSRNGLHYMVPGGNRVTLTAFDMQGRTLLSMERRVTHAGVYTITPVPRALFNQACIIEMFTENDRCIRKLVPVR